jgi:FimV-like protein
MTTGLESSIKKYTEQLAQDPKSRAFVPLSDAYRQCGRCEEAIAVAKEGLSHHPTYVSGKISLARAYFENGDIDLAFGLLEEVLETSPDNLLANRIFAEVSFHKKSYAQAKTALERVLSLEPNDQRCKGLLERIVKAEAAPEPSFVPTPQPMATVASETSPSVNSATLAELYRSQGHLDDALKVYLELMAKDPHNETYRTKVAELKQLLEPKPNVPSPMVVAHSSHRKLYESLLERIAERRRSV